MIALFNLWTNGSRPFYRCVLSALALNGRELSCYKPSCFSYANSFILLLETCDKLHVKNSLLRFVTQTRSAYHLYGKPGNSGENSNGTVHPGRSFPEKSNTFRSITFFPFFPKQPKFYVSFVWITSARLHVERKRKIYRYFLNGKTQFRSSFRCQQKFQLYQLTKIFHRNFRTNSKRSLRSSPASLLYSKARGPFLERPGNFSGPKADFEIKACWIVTEFETHKPVSFALLTDTFIVSICKLLKLWS